MKTERMQLTINYKNGNQTKQLVHYVHYENGAIFFTLDKQVSSAAQMPVRVPMENIERYDLEKVMCEGWKVMNNG